MENKRWFPRKVRGENTPNLIEYIVVAEFDIDTGSTVRHQYPNSIPGYKTDYFAEYMLPEGVHNRERDYTYLFLNKKSPQLDQNSWISPHSSPPSFTSKEMDYLANETSLCDNTGDINSMFLYGINLVKTKYDKTVRRGAIVKAIAIFSKYSFIEVFKVPLDILLERYYVNPYIETISDFFVEMNSAIDLSGMPYPNTLEQCLMRRGVHHHIYKNIRSIELYRDHLPSSWVYDIALPEIFQISQMLSSSDAEGATLTVNPAHKRSSKKFGEDNKTIMSNVVLSIPLYYTPDEVGCINTTLLCKIFGEHVMKIYHAVLTKQRILFVGYNHSAEDLAQMVLSTVAMICPPLTNVIRRAYPYATLSDLKFLEVKGYISGVTNPMFQQHEEWWDLLCVLDMPNNTGNVYEPGDKRLESDNITSQGGKLKRNQSSSQSRNNGNSIPSAHSSRVNLLSYEESPHYSLDIRFITEVISGIQHGKLPESWVRQQFYDYTSAILNHAQHPELLRHVARRDEKAKRFVEANAIRMPLVQVTSEFQELPTNIWVWSDLSKEKSNKRKNTSSGMKLTSESPEPAEKDSDTDKKWTGTDCEEGAESLVTEYENKSDIKEKTDFVTKKESETEAEDNEKTIETELEIVNVTEIVMDTDAQDDAVVNAVESQKDLYTEEGESVDVELTSLHVKEENMETITEVETNNTPDATLSNYDAVMAAMDINQINVSSCTQLRLHLERQNITGDVAKMYLRRLQYEYIHSRNNSLDDEELRNYNLTLLYKHLEKFLVTESVIQGLLVMLPESQGGLIPLAMGLFHGHASIRLSTVNILRNVIKYDSCRSSFSNLNKFILFGFNRQLKKLEEGVLQQEVEAANRLSDAEMEAARLKVLTTGIKQTGSGIGAQKHYTKGSSSGGGYKVESITGSSANTSANTSAHNDYNGGNSVVDHQPGGMVMHLREDEDEDEEDGEKDREDSFSFSAPFTLLQQTLGGILDTIEELNGTHSATDGQSRNRFSTTIDEIDLIP